VNHFTDFALEDLYNQIESKIKHDLSAATMPAMSLNELLAYYSKDEQQTILDSILNTKLSYSTQYGSELVREKISKLYIEHSALSVEHIMLTSGASEAIFLVMSTMFAAGDSIIVQQPIYQSLYQVAADHGVNVINWNLRHPEGAKRPSGSTQAWCLEELSNLIKKHPQAKALIINNPNNPTGLGFKREELQEIASLLDGRYLISDEVFLFNSQSHLPSALEIYKNSIVISDLSKSFNMPGLRLGWIATPLNVLEQCSSLKNYLSLRTNTLSEVIAPWVLEKHAEISSKNRSLIKSNIEHLYSLDPDQLAFDLSQIPQNNIEGLCIFPRMKDESVIDQLWTEEGVFAAKGVNFGEKWGKYLRIGLKDKFSTKSATIP
jgi:aspartate/methionine/tyrosine aminotransferase